MLDAKHPPFFGLMSLYILLGICFYLTLTFRAESFGIGEKGITASAIGYVLPQSFIRNREIFDLVRIVFCISAISWCMGLLIPFSSWCSVFSFTIFGSLVHENVPYILHKYHVPNALLVVNALWYHFYKDALNGSWSDKDFWSKRSYPEWVHWSSVCVISIFYGYSGLSKLLYSGLEWPNGVTLQLWTLMWGDKKSSITELILSNRQIAAVVQSIVLIAECLAPFAIISKKIRVICGVVLVGFHVINERVFHLDFWGNAILIVLFYFPIMSQIETCMPNVIDKSASKKKTD